MSDQRRLAECDREQEAREPLLADIRIVLRARDVELAARDLPIADHPVVAALVLAHPLQRVVGIEGGDQRRRAVPAAGRIEHEP